MNAQTLRLRSMALLGGILAALQTPMPLLAATPASVAGEYQCDDCLGYLTVQRHGAAELRVSLGISGGSCSGEPPLTRTFHYTGGAFALPYTAGKRQCAAHIAFVDQGAVVTDSCFTAQDEADSTCATQGRYTKRKP